MKIIETEYWCLMLPPEWSAEQNEDVVMITDQDGICLLYTSPSPRD